MRVRKIIYISMLVILGVSCMVLFIAERVTGQLALMRIVGMDLYDFMFGFLCLICIGAFSLLIRSWRKTVRKIIKALLVFGWIVTIGMLVLGSMLELGRHVITSWYEFNSPDHKYSLVAGESTFLLLSDIHLYERTSLFLVRELKAGLSPDDGFAAISRGAYKISWDGDVVTLSADMNQNGLWDTVKLDMADHGKVLTKFSTYPNRKPAWLDSNGDTNKNDEVVSSPDTFEQEDMKQLPAEQRVIEGLRTVAKTIDGAANENQEITYNAKGTPKIVLSSDLKSDKYILYDRDSANKKCALYVLYQSDKGSRDDLNTQIVEMYAYEYSNGKVITADRHSWSDVGTDEYREATGE